MKDSQSRKITADHFSWMIERSINHYESKYATGEHPEAAWQAITVCDTYGLPWPEWVTAYVSETAKRIAFHQKTKKRHAQVLTEALGGLTKVNLNAIRNEARDFEVYLGVESLMNEERKPVAARREFTRRNKNNPNVGKETARTAHKAIQQKITQTREDPLLARHIKFSQQIDSDIKKKRFNEEG